MMAIAFVQEKDSGPVNAVLTTSLSVTLGITPIVGNLIVILGAANRNGTGLALSNAGFTSIKSNSGSIGTDNVFINTWYKVVTATPTGTYTITTTNAGHLGLWVAEYSGIDTSTVIDVSIISGYCQTGIGSTLTARPGFKNGLYLLGFWEQETSAGTTPAGFGDVLVHSAVLRGNEFSHTNGSDNRKGRGRVYEYMGTGGFQEPADASWNFLAGTAATGFGVAMVFKEASPGTAVDILSTGTGTAAVIQSTATVQAAGSVFNPSFAVTPTKGNLLVVPVAYKDNATTATITVPAGWSLYGNFNHVMTQNRWASAVYYKVAGSSELNSYTFTLSASVGSLGLASLEYSAAASIPADPTDLAPVWDGHDVGAPAVASEYGTLSGANTGKDNLEIALMGINSGALNTANAPDNSFTRRAHAENTSGLVSIAVYDKFTKYPGRTLTRILSGATITAAVWGGIFSFKLKAGGADHWAWAEGSDDMDSWG